MDAKIFVILGPMGCGKTTVGKLLAETLGWKFIDADDFHPPENVKKMEDCVPLTDEDRIPWLQTLHKTMSEDMINGKNCVVACSALREFYRKILGIDQKKIVSIYLKGTQEMLQERLRGRKHPYMNNNLLTSQLEALEEPQSGITVNIVDPPKTIVNTILEQIHIK